MASGTFEDVDNFQLAWYHEIKYDTVHHNMLKNNTSGYTKLHYLLFVDFLSIEHGTSFDSKREPKPKPRTEIRKGHSTPGPYARGSNKRKKS